MTEHDYLTSANPRALWEAFGERMSERQKRHFVEACRHESRTIVWGHTWSKDEIDGRVETWMSYHNHSEVSLQKRASIFRDILGNPFRKFALCRHHPDPYHQSCTGRKCPEHQEEMRRLLTWQDGTIPALAKACYAGETCETCDNGYNSWPDMDGITTQSCGKCHGTGTITPATLDPFKLQVLADALEEAGCADEWVLGHLRATKEKCPSGFRRGGRCQEMNDVGWNDCIACHGTGYCPIIHVAGCWAVEMFLPREGRRLC